MTAAHDLAGDAGAGLAVRSRLHDDGRGAQLAVAAAHLLFVQARSPQPEASP